MTKVGAQRAADLTGRSKSTIQRAMNAGKLPFETDQTGRRLILVDELERIFGLKPEGRLKASGIKGNQSGDAQDSSESEELQGRVDTLEKQISSLESQVEDLRKQRDEWQEQARQSLLIGQTIQKQIEDLAQSMTERDRREQERRRQMIEARARAEGRDPAKSLRLQSASAPDNQNEPHSGGSADGAPRAERRPLTAPSEQKSRSGEPESGGFQAFQGIWQKIKTRTGVV